MFIDDMQVLIFLFKVHFLFVNLGIVYSKILIFEYCVQQVCNVHLLNKKLI